MVVIDLERFRETFFEEAAEHVAHLEAALLRFEADPSERELIGAMFRAAHSIKGACGTFGLADLGHLTHSLETLLDGMRAGTIAPSAQSTDLLLRATDVLRELLRCARAGLPAPETLPGMIAALDLACGTAAPAPGVAAAPHSPAAESGSRTWQLRFTPGPGLLREGLDPLLLLRELASLATIRQLRCDSSRLPALNDLDPESLYLAWTITFDSQAKEQALRDVFEFALDSSSLELAPAVSGEAAATHPIEGSAALRQTQEHSIRVPTEKVDALINLVGEVVIAQSMIVQALTDFSAQKLPELQRAVTEMERNTREMQQRVMSIRMVPLGSVFSRFPRLVRDLAQRVGKQVTLQLSGEEIELDKGVAEGIGDPLTHLVRNAVDHGFEATQDRLAGGKPPIGTLRLAAFHEGGNVVVEVADDGRGLNTGRIRAKAVGLGLVGAEQAVSDEQIHALIFSAGFSTADEVTDISGRGVGMDVVKRNIEALNGRIELSTAAGAGTRVRLTLPLTLAIIDGLSLGLGGSTYILPLGSIVESLRPRPTELRSVTGGGEVLMVRGRPLPLLRLHQLLGRPDAITDPSAGLVVIVEDGTERLGLLVDELLGQHQVVIKSLEANYSKVDGVMGATILGDGRVALILDVASLARMHRGDRRRQPAAGTAAPVVA